MNEAILFLSQHPLLTCAWLIAFILLAINEIRFKKHTVYGLSSQELIELINHKNAVLMDLRSKESFQKGHIIKSLNITADKIKTNSKKIKTRPIVLICEQGNTAAKLCCKLRAENFKNTFYLHNGMKSWYNENLPLVKSN